MGVVVDRGDWIVEGQVLGCAYPRRDAALAALAAQGVSVVVNLHERAHDPSQLARLGLNEVHIPVRDFTAPTPEQLAHGVATVERAVAEGARVAVHCGAGLGRTGTLLACYLVSGGMDPAAAIEHVRAARPGSVETRQQEEAVAAFGRSRASDSDA